MVHKKNHMHKLMLHYKCLLYQDVSQANFNQFNSNCNIKRISQADLLQCI